MRPLTQNHALSLYGISKRDTDEQALYSNHLSQTSNSARIAKAGKGKNFDPSGV